jgi:hypothetical protein
MVLGAGAPGRVGRCQAGRTKAAHHNGELLLYRKEKDGHLEFGYRNLREQRVTPIGFQHKIKISVVVPLEMV